MSDAKDIKKKKTLSLKLGAKPSIPPSTSIEAGRTVVVAKKRVRKTINTENQASTSDKPDAKSNTKSNDNETKSVDEGIKKSRFFYTLIN